MGEINSYGNKCETIRHQNGPYVYLREQKEVKHKIAQGEPTQTLLSGSQSGTPCCELIQIPGNHNKPDIGYH